MTAGRRSVLAIAVILDGSSRLSGSYWRRHRYAIPHFFDVDPDTMIACVPTCQSATGPPKFEPITYDAYALWYARRNYRHLNH